MEGNGRLSLVRMQSAFFATPTSVGRFVSTITAFVLFSLGSPQTDAFGADESPTVSAQKEQLEGRGERLFRDREFQLDLYGLGDFYESAEGTFAGRMLRTGGKARQFSGRPAWGFGAGASFFFFRYFGVGVEQDVFGRSDGGYRRGDFGYIRWGSLGSLYLRYPLDGLRLAPYAMAGGGAFYGNVPNGTIKLPRGRTANYRLSGQGLGHVGGGLECRLTRNMGIFSDLRYLFSRVEGLPEDQLLWRFGVRFAF